MHVLGVSCYYHDAAAALLSEGQLVAAAEEERFSRKKHDSGYPVRAIDFCLQQAGIRAAELDYVVFYERPLRKLERVITCSLESWPRSYAAFRRSMQAWFGHRLWLKRALCRHLRLPPERVLFVDHHLSHAASAFFSSPFEQAAILTVDGVGEWTTTAIGSGWADWNGTGKNQIVLDREIQFPHSLGLLYSAFTAFLGFEVNEGEYKVMGMAPYGEPRYLEKIERLLRLYPDGSFWLDMSFFEYHRSSTATYSPKFVELFGKPRDARENFVTQRTHPDFQGPRELLERNQHYADLAASIQRITEEAILAMAREAHRNTGMTRLCLAGGVALNSVANGRILRETPIEELYIQPAAGDSGGALGAALYAYHVLLGKPRRFVMEHAYWGKEYPQDQVVAALKAANLSFETLAEERVTQRVVEGLLDGKVVGWYQGRFEWGPRALGNRSILADPRRAEMKEVVNEKIKFREPFRPFAPVILEESVGTFFQNDVSAQYPARFMLLVEAFRPDKQELVPAVSHEGTGRLQTVQAAWNPRYHSLVQGFGQATGVPVLMNTSFNLRGEPIVSTPAEAISTFLRSGLDILVLGDCLTVKP